MVSRIEFSGTERKHVSPEIEKLTVKPTTSTESLRSLINSVTSDYEDRLLLQDSIDGIQRDAEAFISYLYCMTSSVKRDELLSVYGQILKDMIGKVDTLLKKK
ncbi:MAG TPA: hypothetical protein VIR31_04020 [Nitrososphaeraceae archaeon]